MIALGEKEFETRSWQTKYLGKLAIHGGKSVDKEAWHHKEIQKTLIKQGIKLISDLPIGFIIAIGELADCQRFIGDYGYFARTEKAESVRKNIYLGILVKGDMDGGYLL